MYLYFDKTGKISTVIPHGEPARQGSPLKLFICFDYDFFESKGLQRENIGVYVKITKPGQKNPGVAISPITEPTLEKFDKNIFSEVTYNLIPGKRYWTYKFSIMAQESTEYAGKIKVATFLLDKAQTVNDLNESGQLVPDKNIYYQATTDIFVEKTFGNPQTITLENPFDEESIINNILEKYGSKIDNLEGTRRFFRGTELPTDGYTSNDIFLNTSTGDIYKAISTEEVLEWAIIIYGSEYVDELEARLQRQINANSELSSQNAAKIGVHTTQIAILQDRMSDAERDIRDADLRIDKAESNITNLQGRMTTEEGNVDNLQQHMGVAEVDIAELKNRITAEEGKVANLQPRVSSAESQISNLNQTVSNLSNRATSAESRLGILEPVVDSTSKDVVKLKTGEIAAGKADKYTGGSTTIKTKFDQVESDYNEKINKKMNKVFSDLGLLSSIGDNAEIVFNINGEAKRITFSNFKEAIYSGDFHRGYYPSLAALQAKVTDPKEGDYAFVDTNIDGQEDLVMYIWDSNDKVWSMTNASQYLKSTVFELFQKDILNGTTPVGKANDYNENEGTIGAKFAELERQTFEFSDEIEEGNETQPTLKQLKFGDDIWIIPESKGVLLQTGEELESIDFEEGRLYLCTDNSESFTENELYVGTKDNTIKKLQSSNISLEPTLTSFTVSSPSGTLEVGSTVYSVKYSFNLKYPHKLINAHSSLLCDGTVVDSIYELNTTNSRNISTTYKNSSTGTKTIRLNIYEDNNLKFNRNQTYEVAQRYYYGILSSNVNDTILSSSVAEQNFKNILSNTDTVKTSLSQLSRVTLKIPSYSYVWFLIPTDKTIQSATSGGFDFPYQTQSNISMQNSYGTTVSYKVYRSSNKVIGDITINLG